MGVNSFKQIQTQSFYLSGSGSSIGNTTIVLSSLTTIDGVAITMTDIGDKGFFTIEPGSGTQEEAGTFGGITQNGDGTVTLTDVQHQLFEDPYTETQGLNKSHAGGVTLIFSNTAGFYQGFLRLGDDNTITDVITFTSPNYPQFDTPAVLPILDGQFATKKYVDGVAIAGASDMSTSVKGIAVISSNPLSAPNPVVLNSEEVSATSGANKVVRAGAGGKISTGYIDQTATYTWTGTQTFNATTSVVGSATFSSSPLVATATLVANAVVSLDATAKLPIVDGSQLTSIHLSMTASDNLKNSSDGASNTTNASYTIVKETIVRFMGTLRVKFALEIPTNDGTVNAQIYRNGGAVGTERTMLSSTPQTFSEDIADIAIGDRIQIYAHSNGTKTARVTNFRLYYNLSNNTGDLNTI